MQPYFTVEEEKRRRLLDPPWGWRLDSRTPNSERERSATKPKVTSPLDQLLCPAFHLEGDLSFFSTISSTWTGLGALVRIVGVSNEKECPILDGLLQELWGDQAATSQRLSQLENYVITRSNTKGLLRRASQLTSSPLSNTRASGYSLLKFVSKHHQPLSVTQRHEVWISVRSFGIEKEEQPRYLQIKALTTLLGPRGNIIGSNETLTQILSWIGEGASISGASDLITLTKCHNIVKRIIKNDIDPLGESQIDEIVRAYCNLVTLLIEASEQNGTVRSRDAATTLAVSRLIQILELVLYQGLIPELLIKTLVQTLCLVLGYGGESRPSAFGRLSQGSECDMDETYQRTAQAILGLLCHKLYGLPVLENLEDILRQPEAHSRVVCIGAANAVCERVWAGLEALFENGSHDGVRSEREDLVVSFDEEMTILQDTPQEWLKNPGSDALFTRVIKVMAQVVHQLDFETSPSVRHFMNVTMSRIAILVEKFR